MPSRLAIALRPTRHGGGSNLGLTRAKAFTLGGGGRTDFYSAAFQRDFLALNTSLKFHVLNIAACKMRPPTSMFIIVHMRMKRSFSPAFSYQRTRRTARVVRATAKSVVTILWSDLSPKKIEKTGRQTGNPDFRTNARHRSLRSNFTQCREVRVTFSAFPNDTYLSEQLATLQALSDG